MGFSSPLRPPQAHQPAPTLPHTSPPPPPERSQTRQTYPFAPAPHPQPVSLSASHAIPIIEARVAPDRHPHTSTLRAPANPRPQLRCTSPVTPASSCTSSTPTI